MRYVFTALIVLGAFILTVWFQAHLPAWFFSTIVAPFGFAITWRMVALGILGYAALTKIK